MLKDKIINIITSYKKYIIIVLIVLLVGSSSFFVLFNYLNSDKDNSNGIHNSEKTELTKAMDSNDKTKENEDKVPTFFVDIKGAITFPNVYELQEGSRIVDVIKMAGGLTKDADTSALNLSKKVIDEMNIIIYTKSEIKQFRDKGTNNINEIIKYINKDCNCPDPGTNDACINNTSNIDNTADDNSNINGKISINTANSEQLQTLPGIGVTKAQAIIAYRDTNGFFKIIEDIKNVSGIGDSTFAQIKDYITI